MTGLALLLAQLAPAQLPDIEIAARVSAREVEIEQEGEARLTLHAEPGEAEPVRVERSAPAGRKSYRNLTIDLRAAARIAPDAPSTTTTTHRNETGEPR